MKYFKKQKPNVGDRLIGGDVGPVTARDKLIQKVEDSRQMNRRKAGISRIFAPLTNKEADLIESQIFKTSSDYTRLP